MDSISWLKYKSSVPIRALFFLLLNWWVMVTWQINNYKKALKNNLDYAEAHFNLGYVCKDKGDLEAAIASYNQALMLLRAFFHSR